MTDWSQIVQEHGPMVWKTVRRLVGNEADGADCFQRAFLSALELSRKEVIRNWPGLLQRLATVRALECLRQRRRDSNRLTTLPEASAIDRKSVSPLKAAETKELVEQLREALADLDARQAQVFCLACLDGLSYEQISCELDITVTHVGVLLNRARSNLRGRLQVHGPVPAAENIEREVQS
jgi:RNA polymerase sigma-70 factor (ECF subfamily)